MTMYGWKKYNNKSVQKHKLAFIRESEAPTCVSGGEQPYATGYRFTSNGFELVGGTGSFLKDSYSLGTSSVYYNAYVVGDTTDAYDARENYELGSKGKYLFEADKLELTENRRNNSKHLYITYKVYENQTYYDDEKGAYIDQVASTSSTTYPKNGKSGDYWYEYIGTLNETPTISGKDEDLGGMKKAFTRTFTVDDKDQDQTLKVVVKLNGISIHTITNATRNTDYMIDINDELFNGLPLNQKNTIEITVDDGNGATTVRRYYFSRVNTPPVVQVNQSNMGEKNTPFSFTYTATDVDSDALTSKIYLDDVQVEDVGALTLGKENTYTLKKLDYAKLLNGDHKVRVEVTDANGAKGYGYVNFSKNVKSGFYRLKRETKDVVATVIVNPSVELAEGATMTIKVCNNVYDASPAWETVPKELIGQSYNLQNKAKTASKWGLGIDVTIDRGSATKDSYFYGLVGSWR